VAFFVWLHFLVVLKALHVSTSLCYSLQSLPNTSLNPPMNSFVGIFDGGATIPFAPPSSSLNTLTSVLPFSLPSHSANISLSMKLLAAATDGEIDLLRVA
jgi:hypothetical protein